jgi:hypothetical protein
VLTLVIACSASDPATNSSATTGSGSGQGGAGGQGATGGSIVTAGTVGTGGSVTQFGGNGGTAGTTACASTSVEATLTSAPVDIVVILDNSGSMQEEMKAAEANINQNFATILSNAGIDYRVILLSRHRRQNGDSGEASTSICVSAPLSGLAACPAEVPVFSERFFQYSEKIESFDALNWILDGWSIPPENDDYAVLAPMGWSPWLREGSKKAFVIMTDDDESNDDEDTPLSPDAFMTALSALGPTHFGTLADPTYTFHSVIGVAEKPDATAPYLPSEPPVTTMCTGNGAVIESPGPTYQELSIRTGGLRFPICQFPGYDAVFKAIAADVIVKAEIACDFPIPAPPEGEELDLNKVAVSKKLLDGTALPAYGQAATPADCQADAFYIDQAQNRIFLCPETCTALEADPAGGVDVLFTCENTIIVK